jgi:hypothetical protein
MLHRAMLSRNRNLHAPTPAMFTRAPRHMPALRAHAALVLRRKYMRPVRRAQRTIAAANRPAVIFVDGTLQARNSCFASRFFLGLASGESAGVRGKFFLNPRGKT